MEKKPKISVIMPNYNSAEYIKQAIESILNQTFLDFEFIIIDDWSTDNSWELIQECAKKDERIIAIKNEENLKICDTLNKWLNLSRWEFIARMDSDDISLKDRFEKQINFLEKNIDIWVIWSNCIFINNEWKKIGSKNYPEYNHIIKSAIWFRNPMLHPSVIFRKSCTKEFWLYDKEFLYAEDLELWIRFWKKWNFYNIQENLVKYRIYWWNSTIKKQKIMIKNTLKARREAIKIWYKVWFKGVIYYIWTYFMQFFPPKFVLWFFNKIT